MIIKNITIENFQSHENTFMDFEKGLNVILGPSDNGKTAIIRAIKWVLYNEPRGFEFIRHGTSMARVSIEFDNNHIVVRERSQSKNRYIIINPDKTQVVFEGFGNEIPQEVIKLHGIPKVMLDTDIDTCINLGEQLDGPFLLSESGSVRAKAIGRLTGIHVIDKAIRDSIIDIKRENQTLDRVNKELESVNLKLEKYDNIYKLEKNINDLGGIIEILEQYIERQKKLVQYKKNLEENEYSSSEIKNKLNTLNGITNCELSIKNAEIFSVKLSRLLNLKNKLDNLELEIKKTEEFLAKSSFINEGDNLLNRASDKSSVIKQFEICYKNYYEITKNIAEGNKFLESNKKETRKLLQEYIQLLKKQGKCPLCKSEISDSKINEIIEIYEGES